MLSGAHLQALLPSLADDQIIGGTTYDALIGLTARESGAQLLTCDRRAAPVYQAVGAQTRWLQ